MRAVGGLLIGLLLSIVRAENGTLASAVQCEAGMFAHVGAGGCEPCPAGHVSAAGASACTPCAAGSYAAGGLMCLACESRTYQTRAGQSSCSECPQHSEHRAQRADGSHFREGATGATSIDDCVCEEGFVKMGAGGSWSCRPCVEGMQCAEAGAELATVPLLPGYWRGSARSVDVRACPRADDCVGGSDPASYCVRGSTGPLCDACVEGWFRTTSGVCAPCSPVDRYPIALLAVAVLALLSLLAALTARALLASSRLAAVSGRIERAASQLLRSGALYRASVHFRSVYAFAQVLAALDLHKDVLTAYPALAGAVRSLRVINLDVTEALGSRCTAVGLFARLYVLCLLPIAALVPVGAYLGVEALLTLRRARALRRAAGADRPTRRRMRAAAQQRSLASAGMLLARTALYCSYAVVPSIMSGAFRFFDCVVVDTSAPEPDSARYLRHELAVPCGTAQTGGALAFLVGAICVYGVLVPAALAHALAPRSGLGLTLLSTGYKPTFVWFEVAETVRKGLIVGLSVLARTRAVGRGRAALSAGRETQLLFAFTVQAVHTFLFSQVSPLHSPEAMAVGVGVHTALSLSLVLLALLAAAGRGDEGAAGGAAAGAVVTAARARTLTAFAAALVAGALVAAYALVMHRAAIEAERAKRQPIVLVTAPGEDLDGEMALLLAKWMQEEGLVDLKAVVANLHPARTRARLVRGVLDALRLQHVPVGVGTDGGTTATADTFSESASHYICPPNSARAAALEPARALLHRTLSAARDRSITLVCLSSLKDAALFLRDNGELCAAKLKRVVVMGGVAPDWHAGSEDGETWLKPDNARNNRLDVGAANYFYSACQHAGIPMSIVTRHAACAAPVPRETYDFLAQSGSPIGWRLRKAQRDNIELLWRRACAAPGSELRGDLPERCSREWFISTFCVGDVGERDGEDAIWDTIASFQLYDATALVAAVPALASYLFNPTAVRISGVEHAIVGESEEEHGVRSARDLSSFMLTAIADAIGVQAGAHAGSSHVIVVLLDSPTASAVPALLLLRALLDLNMLQCDSMLIVRERGGAPPRAGRGGGGGGGGSADAAGSGDAVRCAESLGLATLTQLLVVDDDATFASQHTRTSSVFVSSSRVRRHTAVGSELSAAAASADAVEALAAVYESVGVRTRLVVGGAIPLALARFAREEALVFREKTESVVALGEFENAAPPADGSAWGDLLAAAGGGGGVEGEEGGGGGAGLRRPRSRAPAVLEVSAGAESLRAFDSGRMSGGAGGASGEGGRARVPGVDASAADEDDELPKPRARNGGGGSRSVAFAAALSAEPAEPCTPTLPPIDMPRMPQPPPPLPGLPPRDALGRVSRSHTSSGSYSFRGLRGVVGGGAARTSANFGGVGSSPTPTPRWPGLWSRVSGSRTSGSRTSASRSSGNAVELLWNAVRGSSPRGRARFAADRQTTDGPDSRRACLLQPHRGEASSKAASAAAQSLTEQCAAFGIPMRLVSAQLADECALPSCLYDELSQLAGEIGGVAHGAVKAATLATWAEAHAHPDERPPGGLPAQIDADWFEERYCSGARAETAAEAWALARTVPFPAGAVLLAASDRLSAHYLRELDALLLKAVRHVWLGGAELSEPPSRPVFLAQMLAKAAMHDLSHFSTGAGGGEPARASAAEAADGGCRSAPTATAVPDSLAQQSWEAGRRGSALAGGKRRLPAALTLSVDGLGTFEVSDALPAFLQGGALSAAARTGWLAPLRLAFNMRAPLAEAGGAGAAALLSPVRGGPRSPDRESRRSRGPRRGATVTTMFQQARLEMKDADQMGETSRERFERVRNAARTGAAPPRAVRAGEPSAEKEKGVMPIEGYVRKAFVPEKLLRRLGPAPTAHGARGTTGSSEGDAGSGRRGSTTPTGRSRFCSCRPGRLSVQPGKKRTSPLNASLRHPPGASATDAALDESMPRVGHQRSSDSDSMQQPCEDSARPPRPSRLPRPSMVPAITPTLISRLSKRASPVPSLRRGSGLPDECVVIGGGGGGGADHDWETSPMLLQHRSELLVARSASQPGTELTDSQGASCSSRHRDGSSSAVRLPHVPSGRGARLRSVESSSSRSPGNSPAFRLPQGPPLPGSAAAGGGSADVSADFDEIV